MKFINRFSNSEKSYVSNIVLFSIRKGLSNNQDIVFDIKKQLEIKLKWGQNDTLQKFAELLEIADNGVSDVKEEIDEVIDYYKEWEKMSPDEKQLQREDKSIDYIREAMSKKEPTEKQIEFLSKNGIINFNGNRYDASCQIDKIINPQ